jgi:hypothetical protein
MPSADPSSAMQIRTIRRYTFEHKPLHFGEASESDFEYLSIHTAYDDQGRLVEETKYLADGKADEVNRFTYTPGGKLAEHVMEMVAEGMRDVFRYERDDAGRLVREQKYYGDDPGEATAYTYNDKGEIAERLKTDADGEFESREAFTYNDKGDMVTRTATDAEGKLIEKSVLDYDGSGNLASRKDYDADGTLTATTEYTYNPKNAIESVIRRNAAGKLIESVRYAYDERDNIVEKAVRDFHPRTFRYTYNEKNECVEEMLYDQHGQLNSKSVFEFNENGDVVQEITYHMDVNRHDLNKGHRYEYEYYA